MPLVSPRVVKLPSMAARPAFKSCQRVFRQVRQQVLALRLHHFAGGPELVGGGIVAVFFLLQGGTRLFDQLAVLARQLGQLDQFVAAALDPCGPCPTRLSSSSDTTSRLTAW